MAASMAMFARRTLLPSILSQKMREGSMKSLHRKHHQHTGKVALVTGSTEGIGFAIARRLGQDGAKVVINSRKQAKVDRAVDALKKDDIEVLGVAGHAAKQEDRSRLISEAVKCFGGIDILVNNAGTNPYFGVTSQTPEDAWDKLWDTNVKSGFFLTQQCLPHLKKRGGSVIFVSSITAYQPFDLIGVYSITKLAMVGMVKALSTELAASNIRVNAIAPGLIDTKFTEAFSADPQLKENACEKIPMGRFGKADECSGAVSFLASDDAAYITGETIVMSGGMQSRL